MFVFMRVNETVLDSIFVKSLRRHHPDATIIQVSDEKTAEVPGVTEVVRVRNSFPNRLMLFRLRLFLELQIEKPALYLDADMICINQVDIEEELKDADVALCQRMFGCEELVSGALHKGYEGTPIGSAWPYLACATMTRDSKFWEDAFDAALDLTGCDKVDDQEAIKQVAGRYKTRILPENIYAHPPELRGDPMRTKFLHFKGKRRKMAMLECARMLRYL
jgi:hypothetical protein